MAKFIWIRLATADADGAQRFYQGVVGWGVDRPEGAGEHRILTAGGIGIGGIAPPDPGEPLGWVGYVEVDDVDAEIAAVEAAGGRCIVPAFDVPMAGRIARLADPQGAAYLVIAPAPWEGEVPPAPSRQTPGQIGWHELHTPDMDAGFAFYADRYGWTLARDLDMGPMGTYRIFAIDGEDAGGVAQATPLAPAWLHYFTVPDIDAAAAAIGTGGGTVTSGPHEVPGGAWIVHANDPQGAVFALVGGRGA